MTERVRQDTKREEQGVSPHILVDSERSGTRATVFLRGFFCLFFICLYTVYKIPLEGEFNRLSKEIVQSKELPVIYLKTEYSISYDLFI